MVKIDGGRAERAGIHHLDVHPFLDFGSSTIATTLLKRGRDEKAISALSSRPRFNRVVAIVAIIPPTVPPLHPDHVLQGIWDNNPPHSSEITIAQPSLERGQNERVTPGHPYCTRSSDGCVIVVSGTWGGFRIQIHCNMRSGWSEVT